MTGRFSQLRPSRPACCSVIFSFFFFFFFINSRLAQPPQRGELQYKGGLCGLSSLLATHQAEWASTSSAHSSSAAFLCIACAFSLSRMGKKWVPTDPQQMNLPIYEGFFFLWDGYGGFVSVVFIETLCSYEHRILMPMSERSSILQPANWFSMHFFPCLSGLTGCGCLGIIIIISGNLSRNWSLDSAHLTQAIFHFRLYLREG